MRAGWYNDDDYGDNGGAYGDNDDAYGDNDDAYGDNDGDVDGDVDTDHDSNKRNVLFCTVCTVWSVFSSAKHLSK